MLQEFRQLFILPVGPHETYHQISDGTPYQCIHNTGKHHRDTLLGHNIERCQHIGGNKDGCHHIVFFQPVEEKIDGADQQQ